MSKKISKEYNGRKYIKNTTHEVEVYENNLKIASIDYYMGSLTVLYKDSVYLAKINVDLGRANVIEEEHEHKIELLINYADRLITNYQKTVEDLMVEYIRPIEKELQDIILKL